MKKFLGIILLVLIFAMASCSGNHTHTYSEEWSSDENSHWHVATCEHSTELSEKAEHTWDAGKVTLEPTEQAEGKKTFTCTVCQYTKEEKMDKLAHVHSWTDATCTTPKTCSKCNATEGTALGHTPEEAVKENEVAATCTKEGSYDLVVYCSVCDAEISREAKVAEKVAHEFDETIWAYKDAEGHAHNCKNCDAHDEVVAHTSSGAATETDAEICTECGYVIAPATGHITHTPKDEWKSDATHHWHECVGCSTEKVGYAEHTPAEAVKENEVAATCAKEGSYDLVVYCSECNAEISREAKTVEKLNHTPAEAVKENEVEPTYTTEGSYDLVVYCSECNAEISRETKTVEKLELEELIPTIDMDFEGNANDNCENVEATVSGNVTYTDAVDGKAAVVGGSDYIVIPNFVPSEAGFTISTWVNISEMSGDPIVFGTKDWGSGGNKGFALCIEAGGARFNANVSNGAGERLDLYAESDSYLNEWINVTLVADFVEGKWKLSVNFEEFVEMDLPEELMVADPYTGLGQLVIGQDGTGSYGSPLKFAVDKFVVFNRAASQEELEMISSMLELPSEPEMKVCGGNIDFTSINSFDELSMLSAGIDPHANNDALGYNSDSWVTYSKNISDLFSLENGLKVNKNAYVGSEVSENRIYVRYNISTMKYFEAKLTYEYNDTENGWAGLFLGYTNYERQARWGDSPYGAEFFVQREGKGTYSSSKLNNSGYTEGSVPSNWNVNGEHTLTIIADETGIKFYADGTLVNSLTTEELAAKGYVLSEGSIGFMFTNAEFTVKSFSFTNLEVEHTPSEAVKENEVAATCTKEGSYDLVVYCSVCDAEISREAKVAEKVAHEFDETTWAYKDAEGHAHNCKNCDAHDEVVAHTSSGAATETDAEICTECGYVIAPATGHITHTPKDEWKSDATHHWHECVGCSTEKVGYAEHTPAEAVKENEVAATCAKEGSYDLVVYCSECNAEISREAKTVEKLNHTPTEAVKENEVEPTYTTEGSYDLVVYCSECNAEISRETKTVEKLELEELIPTIDMDFEGNANDNCENVEATVNGNVTYTDAVDGKAAVVGGSDYFVIPNFVPGEDGFTISTWVNISEMSGDPIIFGTKDWNSGGNKGFALCIEANGKRLNANIANGSGSRIDLHATSDSYLNEWINITLIADFVEGKWILVINFEEIFETDLPEDLMVADPYTGLGQLVIGQDGTGSYGSPLKFAVDKFIVFNRAAIQEEFKSISSLVKAPEKTYDNNYDFTSVSSFDELSMLSVGIDPQDNNDSLGYTSDSWVTYSKNISDLFLLENGLKINKTAYAGNDVSGNRIYVRYNGATTKYFEAKLVYTYNDAENGWAGLFLGYTNYERQARWGDSPYGAEFFVQKEGKGTYSSSKLNGSGYSEGIIPEGWSEHGEHTLTIIADETGIKFYADGTLVNSLTTEELTAKGYVLSEGSIGFMFTNAEFTVKSFSFTSLQEEHTPGSVVEENRIEATYESAGSFDLVVYCNVCGKEISRETKVIDRLELEELTPTIDMDFEGNANDNCENVEATVNGNVTYTDAVDGKAAVVGGSDYFVIPNFVPGEDGFTISTWINISEMSGDPIIFGTKDWGSGSNIGFALCIEGNGTRLNANVSNGAGKRLDLYAEADSYLNEWINVTLVADFVEGKWKLSVNFEEFVEMDLPEELMIAEPYSGLGQLVIGQDGTGSYSSPLKFTVDKFVVFNRAASQAELELISSLIEQPEQPTEPSELFPIIDMNFEGNGNDNCENVEATANGNVTYTDAVDGQGAVVGGSDYFVIPNFTPGEAGFTISTWINISEMSGDPIVFGTKDWGSGNNIGFALCIEAGGARFNANVSNGAGERLDLYAESDSYLNEWINVTLVADFVEGKWKLSVNFEEFVEMDLPEELMVADPYTGLGQLVIGQDGTGSYGSPLKFTVDRFVVFDYALTLEELSRI